LARRQFGEGGRPVKGWCCRLYRFSLAALLLLHSTKQVLSNGSVQGPGGHAPAAALIRGLLVFDLTALVSRTARMTVQKAWT